MTNEAFARIKIDQLLKDTDWRLTDGISVRYEYPLDDGGRADYALFDRQGRALAVLEAKSTSVSLSAGEAQGRRYADLLDVPFIFLSNGEEIWFCDKGQDAHFRKIETVFSQDDLARRKAARDIRRNPLDIAIDSRIAGGGGRLHQSACIEAVCREIVNGRRKMLVEMATGTGKTRTAAALLKRLFEANWATRALFVVDRNTLAIQAEDAFAEHLPNLPCYRVPRTGRRFQDEKRVTIVTLQTLVNEYEKYSSGYFDLIVIDECHRSIYGQWRRALDHFDGIKVGLTATPCVMQEAPDVDDEDRAAIRDTLRFFEVKGDLFEHVLRQIKQAGELGQFRTPRHIIRAIVDLVDPKIGETVYDPAAGTAGFLVAAYEHIRLANSSANGRDVAELEGKTFERGYGDRLNAAQWRKLQAATFYGNDVDPKMVSLASMNLALRGLPDVRILSATS